VKATGGVRLALRDRLSGVSRSKRTEENR